MTWKDAVNGAKLVHVDEDVGLMIVWNGSATFNVYADRLEPGELDPVDCFTRYACESGHMSFAAGVDWAKRTIQDWLHDKFNEE